MAESMQARVYYRGTRDYGGFLENEEIVVDSPRKYFESATIEWVDVSFTGDSGGLSRATLRIPPRMAKALAHALLTVAEGDVGEIRLRL